MADYDNSRHIFENCHSLNPMCLSAFQPIIWQYGNSFHKKNISCAHNESIPFDSVNYK